MSLLIPRLPSPPPTPLPPEASLSTQERLRLAKRRRAAQLKRWAQRERERNHPDLVASTHQGARAGQRANQVGGGGGGISFVPDVMLLEAAARNDVQEGETLKINIDNRSFIKAGVRLLYPSPCLPKSP